MIAAVAGDDALIPSAVRRLDVESVQLLAPVVRGGRIFCIGLNSFDHQQESAAVFANSAAEPIVFLKAASSIAPPNSTLTLDGLTSAEFDWEAELGVVVGKPARAVDRADAWDWVAGYTVVNDVTARDLQVAHVQWCLGKNVDGATPIGPWVTTRSELGTDPDLEIRLSVNGVVKQCARTSQMIFDVPRLIETISRVTALLPGDIIATGTPAEWGFSRRPPEFLAEGDRVDALVSGIGTLSNTVVTTRSNS